MDILNTIKIQNNCIVINLAPVNHAVKLIPSPHVLLKISTRQNPNHIEIANNIMLKILSKCTYLLASIVATAIIRISMASSISDNGIGMMMFLNGTK